MSWTKHSSAGWYTLHHFPSTLLLVTAKSPRPCRVSSALLISLGSMKPSKRFSNAENVSGEPQRAISANISTGAVTSSYAGELRRNDKSWWPSGERFILRGVQRRGFVSVKLLNLLFDKLRVNTSTSFPPEAGRQSKSRVCGKIKR